MKKSKVIVFLLGLGFMVYMLIVSFQTPERTYTVVIPERLVVPFYQLVNGGADNITLGQLKEITAIVNPQLTQQNKSYALQDSIAAVKNKKDTSNKKP